MAEILEIIHPGEILQEEFMEPLGVSAYALAKSLYVPRSRIHEIITGQRAITADTALRLARYFGNSPDFWLNLQNRYDLEKLTQDNTVNTVIEKITRYEYA